MPKVLIFCESGIVYGMGHYTRCLILADKIKSLGYEIVIHNYEDSLAKEQSWFFQDNILKYLEDEEIRAVVIDSYQADSEIYFEVEKRGIRLVVIDDNARISYPSTSFILNGGIETQLFYDTHRQDRVFAGLEYMICNEVFFQNKQINQQIEKIVICMGGSDEKNYTQQIADLLAGLKYDVTIVVGLWYRHTLRTNFRVLRDIDATKMANLFYESDLAIIAGGRMVNEAIMSQIPSFVLSIAKNQEHQVNLYDTIKVIKKITLNDLIMNLEKFDFNKRQKMSDICSKIKFGDKLKDCLEEILKE